MWLVYKRKIVSRIILQKFIKFQFNTVTYLHTLQSYTQREEDPKKAQSPCLSLQCTMLDVSSAMLSPTLRYCQYTAQEMVPYSRLSLAASPPVVRRPSSLSSSCRTKDNAWDHPVLYIIMLTIVKYRSMLAPGSHHWSQKLPIQRRQWRSVSEPLDGWLVIF